MGVRDSALSPDAACSFATVEATVERQPVDIIWLVDNSSSMREEIDQVQAGLNDFAALIAARDLDSRVIMLSLRGVGETTSGPTRFQVCIPPPLAGPSCGDNAPGFHHIDVDIRSTQPLEQLLGTLGSATSDSARGLVAGEPTPGYAGGSRGSLPWAHLLRPEATKTIVVVSDDNARFVMPDGTGGYEAGTNPVETGDWFEMTADTSDDSNPFNSATLPVGLLHPDRGGLFDDYIFSAIYGWSDIPGDPCQYADGSFADSSGRTYTELVNRTGGVRAQICGTPADWMAFFDVVASAVEEMSGVECSVPIPDPPEGMAFQRTRINVLVDDGFGTVRAAKVPDLSVCDGRGGWFYDDETMPTSIELCPSTCGRVQPREGLMTSVEVQFGCLTIPI